MNFFEHQAAANRRSRRLLWLFALAVLGIVASVDIAMLITFGFIGSHAGTDQQVGVVLPLLFVSLGTLVVILSASLYRIASLRGGGDAVALSLGGSPVVEDTQDPSYRRLRNVVEEIAIASSLPVPRIFVLEQEAGINAFAAGYTSADAVVAVTRGALQRLNRDELQGVIAHEFSHVLNGDMRLNIRLMGMLFGILVVGLAGRKILDHLRSLAFVALALMVVGYIGVFFGRLIKAGVSRQREFLADASAVQFTRQTNGIAGALKKIGGLIEGSKLQTAEAEEASHMLFGDGVGYSKWFATHPPLIDRIRALEPTFTSSALDQLVAQWSQQPPDGMDEDLRLGLQSQQGSTLPAIDATYVLTPPQIAARVGSPSDNDYRHAAVIRAAIPDILKRAAHDTEEVKALLFGLLHAPAGHNARNRQQFELAARQGKRIAEQSLDYADRSSDLHPALRLPLAELSMPVLRKRPAAQLQHFVDSVYALIHADGEISLFEYCLGQLINSDAKNVLSPAQQKIGALSIVNCEAQIAILISVLAAHGYHDPIAAKQAYNAGFARVLPHSTVAYSPPVQWMSAVDSIWIKLDQLAPLAKQQLIEGLVATISHDGKISVSEAELLRVTCALLHCPLPPLLN